MNFDVKSRTIFKCLSGSHAYGTNTETSDKDYRGICIPPESYFLGAFHNFEQAESKPDPKNPDKEDSCIYGIRKFFKLAADNNPNILELLFMPKDCILEMTPWMERIVEHRHKFLSTKVKFSYSGYAIAQLRRIKGHRAFLLNPQTKQPERADFGLPANQDLVVFRKQVEMLNKAGIDANKVLGKQIEDEARYQRAMEDWRHYQDWKENRNKTRAALESKFGVDLKHASHLVRLLRTGYEILTEGELRVRRPDAAELLAIRNEGIWSYEKLIEFADKMDKEMERVYKAGESSLPHSPDINFLNDLCIEVVKDYLKING
jgi:hypothetical protein